MSKFGSVLWAGAALVALSPLAARAEVTIGLATPLTGPYAWSGEQVLQGVRRAVADLNERGGVLGQPVETLVVDDYCDPGQAVAAARKLVQAGVPAVIGHQCSGAAIPASEVYEEAGVLFISPAATNPRLTERGLRTVFRMVGRDDHQGTLAGDYLADAWGDGEIAIVHDGQTYGEGLAEEVRRRLRERGSGEALYEAVTPGQTDFSDLIARMTGAGIDVVFFGGYQAEGGLLARQVRERLGEVQLVVPDGVVGEDFGLIAGSAADGTLMTMYPDARRNPEAAPVVAAFRADGYEPVGGTLNAYAAVQVWARAAEEAGTADAGAVAEALRTGEFDTVLGTIGFDEKGDVAGFEPFVWYVWKDGAYAPLENVARGN